MIKKYLIFALTIILSSVFVSCGEETVIGKWSFSENASVGDIHYLGIGNVEIEFKADKTVILTTSLKAGKEFRR